MNSKHESSSRKDKPTVDWQRVRQRIDAVTDAINRGLTPEEEKAILKARASALARESGAEDTSSGRLEILEFLLAYETYGIELCWVRETIPLKDLTPVPCTPPFVLGLINVRGRIVSVIDIKKFFDLPEKGLTDLNKVIIVQDGGMEFGILADAICGFRSIPLGELRQSLPTLTGIREEYLKGVTGERMVVLDGKKLLNDAKIIIHENIED
jgi:purine-binding chemotaxis protein CheW